jgi:phosphosulfolactate synthase
MKTTDDPMPRVWLVRHGESTWNALGLIQGQANGPELTARGRRQAARAADTLRHLQVQAVYASDLDRARDTAEIIASAHGLPVATTPDLRERCFGSAEGHPLGSLDQTESGIDGDAIVDVHARPEGGESLDDLYARVGRFVQWLAHQGHGGDVVVVAHGGSIRALRAHYADIAMHEAAWDRVANGAITCVRPAAPLVTPSRHPRQSSQNTEGHMYTSTLQLPERTSKPRSAGLTMIVDGGIPTQYFADVVESGSAYLDFVKFGWGTALVTKDLDVKIGVLRDLGIDFYFGGTLFEKFVLQDRLDDFRDLCHQHSCRFVEVSNGTIDLTNSEKAGYIRKLADEFQVISEVGFKDAERSENLPPSRWIECIHEDLDAGAHLVTLESRESGKSGICRPNGELRFGLIEEMLTSGIRAEVLLFETPSTELQCFFVKRIGPNVNLGNIPVTSILGLETIRLGLRADTLTQFEPAVA